MSVATLQNIDTHLCPGDPMSRLQLALNVDNVDDAVTFYSKLADASHPLGQRA